MAIGRAARLACAAGLMTFASWGPVGADSGTTLDLEPETTTMELSAGATVEVTLTLRNLAATPQAYVLNASAPPGWTVHVGPSPVQVAGFAVRNISVNVTAPLDAAQDEEITIDAANEALSTDRDNVTLAIHLASPSPTSSAPRESPTESQGPVPGPSGDPDSATGTPVGDFGNEVGEGDPELAPAGGDGVPWRGLSAEERAGVGVLAVTTALALAWTHEGIRCRALWAATGLFTRLDRSALLKHEVRERIVGAVQRSPGVHYSGLKRELELANGVLLHHLAILQRERLIRTRLDGWRKRFYPSDHAGPFASPQSPLEANVLRAIALRPGVLQRELARELGISKQVVHYHLRKLERLGLVHVERVGRSAHCYPAKKST